MKSCNKCNITKKFCEFHKTGTYNGQTSYRGKCKECFNLQQRETGSIAQKKYRATESYKEVRKKYKNKPEVKAKENERRLNRYYKDKLFAIKKNIRDRTSKAIKAKRWYKTTGFNSYIGCSLDELKIHLETRFTEGMTWDNYGLWEIDHIIPISSANSEPEAIKLAHYTNLQPLWAADNLKKSDTMPETSQSSLRSLFIASGGSDEDAIRLFPDTNKEKS